MMTSDDWRIAVPSVRLRKKPLATRVLDQDLVIFRDAEGTAHALLDRCPHRGARLSRGTLSGGRLSCRYHGWCFDGKGRCQHIPSLRSDQQIPAGIETPSFPCIEQDGYVWAWVGDPERATAAPLPIPEVKKGRWIQSTVSMSCHWLKPIENNVDPTHAAFTHVFSHPQWFQRQLRGVRQGQSEVRMTDHGFALWTPPTAGPDQPIPPRPPVKTQFDLPDRVTVTFGKPYRQVIVLHSIPTDTNSCRLEAMVTVPLPFWPRIRFSRWEHPIYRQDRVVMEGAETWTREIGHDFERSVEADYSTLLVRRIVELAEGGLWETKRDALPQRRILEFRA